MQFIDEATIYVRGGSGGAGSVHWRREKFIPQGGPDGGDGGSGGAVILVADPNLNTLVDLSFAPHLFAEDGEPGGENQKTGADGPNKEVKVPVGTQVFFNEKLVADLSKAGAKWIAARGGRGGKGNTHFKSASNQAPDYSQPGVKGEERTFNLILKSIADVGLVGLPNAGKSTLVKSVSGARPKVADYPFTTLTPELGVVILGDNRRFVLADIPGIIEGAHTGKGLGLEFLRHVERTKVLVYVVDISQTVSFKLLDEYLEEEKEYKEVFNKICAEAIEQLNLLKSEINSYSNTLSLKPSFTVFSKVDVPNVVKIADEIMKNMSDAISISSAQATRLDLCCETMWKNLRTLS